MDKNYTANSRGMKPDAPLALVATLDSGSRRRVILLVAVAAIWSLLAVAFPNSAAAQSSNLQFDSALAIGGPGSEEGLAVAVDAAGNTHITGSFADTVDFDPGPGVFNLTANGAIDAYLAVYDPAGKLIHALSFGDSNFEEGLGIAVDAAGNSHVTGRFQGTPDFDPGPGLVELNARGIDGFLAVYDPAGNLIHAVNIGGADSDTSVEVAVDAAGNSRITGFFKGTADFDPGPGLFELTSTGDFDVFTAVYDSTGNFVRAFSFGGTSDALGLGIAVDSGGNSHISGFFKGTADFDPGSGVFELTSNVDFDAFLAVYDPAGNFVHALSFGGISLDEGVDVAVDAAGNSHITGRFEGTVDFDPGSGLVELTSNGGVDGFLALYDPTGNLLHALNIGGSGFDRSIGVSTDAAGNSFVTGFFEGTADFDPGSGVFDLTSSGGFDGFLAAYSPTGDFVHAFSFGGSGSDLGVRVAVDAADIIHVIGSFTGTVDFGAGSGVSNLISSGAADVFVARYSLGTVTNPTSVCDGKPVTIDLNLTPGATGTAGDDVILGTPGDDVIDAGAGDDTVCAGDGNDTVVGGDGDDTIFGEAGRDVLRGSPGADALDGGDGDDRVLGGIGDDVMTGGLGDDYLGGFGGDDTIDGGPGSETIFGGFGADTINGGSGNDKISGLIGNDIINGGAGNDTLNGDRGNDTIRGGSGNDFINGGNANDVLDGGDGDDSVNGGRADDQLSGGGGNNDTCVGNKEINGDTADATCETIFGVP